MKMYRIIYSAKYRKMGCKYHLRHCVILLVAPGRPKNCLVKLHGGELAVVPYGNLKFVKII